MAKSVTRKELEKVLARLEQVEKENKALRKKKGSSSSKKKNTWKEIDRKVYKEDGSPVRYARLMKKGRKKELRMGTYWFCKKGEERAKSIPDYYIEGRDFYKKSEKKVKGYYIPHKYEATMSKKELKECIDLF
tara:strand:- start:3103 stop:3501 length:399 start_codon:yes stop_codon:yes gene_type:complete